MKNLNNNLLVSIITVCYNSEDHIRKTIESVLNQTYNNIEYIIIDGGSTNNTIDIIKEYESKFNGRMKWISEKDNGVYDAMNKGIELAEGELVGILNSDDWYLEESVELVVNKYLDKKENKKFPVIVGGIYRVDENGNILYKKMNTKKELDDKINKTMPVTHPSVFVAMDIYKEIGVFNTKYDILADYDLILRFYYNEKVEFYFIDKIITAFRTGGLSDKLDLNILWKRTKERYSTWENILSKKQNIFLCTKFLLGSLFRLTAKKLISDNLLNSYYDYKYKN